MDHSLGVEVGHGLGQFGYDPGRLLWGRTIVRGVPLQGAPGHVLQDQEWAITIEIQIDHPGQVGMVELGQGLTLGLQQPAAWRTRVERSWASLSTNSPCSWGCKTRKTHPCPPLSIWSRITYFPMVRGIMPRP